MNDIAIVKLEKPIKFTSSVQPVCLPANNGDVPTPGTDMVFGMSPTNVFLIYVICYILFSWIGSYEKKYL